MKKIYLFMLLFATMQVFSQNIFGGSVSLDYNFLHIVQTNLHADTLKSIAQSFNPLKNGGLSVGIPVQIRIGRWFLLRPQVLFNIGLQEWNYTFQNQHINIVKVRDINVEFPIQLLFSDFKKKNGLGILTGIRGGYNLKQTDNSQNTNAQVSNSFINFQKTYGLLDIGLGYRIKITKKTTLMPELRYSFGIVDIINPTNSLYSQTIAKMRRDKVAFALNIF